MPDVTVNQSDRSPTALANGLLKFKADGVNLNTLRTHPDLVGDVEPLVWGLQEVLDFAEVLLNRDDIDAKADAFIDFLSDRVTNYQSHPYWGLLADQLWVQRS